MEQIVGFITNSGDFVIRNQQVDGDIKFQSDNGSGGTTTYFFLDGSRADGTYLYTEFPDNSIIGAMILIYKYIIIVQIVL